MSGSIQILDPIETPDWNDLVLASAGGSIFHTSNWAAVLRESYGYRPIYFARIGDTRLDALLPMMEVSSWLTGRRGVSLPFTDYCEPIAADEAEAAELRSYIRDHAAQRTRFKYVEFRGGDFQGSTQEPSATFYRHVVDLRKSEPELERGLRSSTKRNIRKAAREGLVLERRDTAEAVADFYRLHCQTRQGHGVPPQPVHFFEKIYEHVIAQGLGAVFCARHEGRTVAAAVYFHFAGKAIYKYGASDRDYQWLRPNNLVMWEALKWYASHGYESLCMGRTEKHHAGLRQFKTGWGAQETIIRYYRYDLARNSWVVEGESGESSLHQLMTRMPIPVLRLAGSVLYKHMG